MNYKSISIPKNNIVKFKEFNSPHIDNSRQLSSNQIKTNNFINKSTLNENINRTTSQKSYLPQNTINYGYEATSPNIHTKKSIFSSYFANSTKNENNKLKIRLGDSIKNNKHYLNFINNLKKTINNHNESRKHNISDDIKILKTYNKREIVQPSSKDYDYSLIIKKLDNWDKDHCAKNKMDLFSLHKTLNNYYKKNKLVEEQNNLATMENMMQEKINYYRYKENKTYGILGNKQRKNSIKFKKDESSEIEDHKRNIFNSFIINNLNKSYAKNKIDFNNKLTKERLNYEHQLHKELMFVNNIIYNKKMIKKEKIKEMNTYFDELDKLNTEYENKKDKFTKEYHLLISNLTHEQNNIISEKLKEVKSFQDNKNLNEKTVKKFEKKKKKNKKKKKKKKKKKTKNDLNNEIKVLEFRRKNRMSTINNQMKKGLDKIREEYNLKFEELYKKKEKLETQLNIINSELNYYKNINEELLREHQLYYLDILKKGRDFRNDGLVWVVKNLFELKINLEYHHFPKYLTHEQIDYLKKLAYLILEENELKIILKVLKKKQKDNRENAKIEYMNFFDTITKEDVTKNKNERNKNNIIDEKKSYDEETLLVKQEIDKKFIKVYQNNEEALKIYLTRSLEDEKLQKIIYYIKKAALYSNNKTDFIKENKISIIEAFLGKTKNKDLFELIINITKRLNEIELNKKAMINKEKEYFLDRLKKIDANNNNAQTLDYIYNKELIKNCLFGKKIDF